MKETESQIRRRRTFAIISHPDAGKTTLTEKLLLYGGAIQQAGIVLGQQMALIKQELTGGRICHGIDQLVAGARELLENISSRYDLYLASNGAASVQAGRLKSAGIEKYFKDIFISEKMGADKPSTAFFQACFAAIPGFDAADALMVGDSLTSDIRGARDAGLRSCWFNPHGATPRPDIKPDYTVRTLEQLPALLQRL